MRLEDVWHWASERVENENEEQRHRRLEEKRLRVENQNDEQRRMRLENMQHRACEQVKNENEEQRQDTRG